MNFARFISHQVWNRVGMLNLYGSFMPLNIQGAIFNRDKKRGYREGGRFMHGFLENVGLLAIFFAVVYGYKKILEYYDLKRMGLYENKKVYQAACEFVRGAETGNVKAILEECFEFEEKDVEKILSRAIPHKTDQDGGYRAFIRSVNKVVGDDLYDERFVAG